MKKSLYYLSCIAGKKGGIKDLSRIFNSTRQLFLHYKISLYYILLFYGDLQPPLRGRKLLSTRLLKDRKDSTLIGR